MVVDNELFFSQAYDWSAHEKDKELARVSTQWETRQQQYEKRVAPSCRAIKPVAAMTSVINRT